MMVERVKFSDVKRASFRHVFQPSRIVIGIFPTSGTESGFSPITLCFSMSSSYRPPMMAVAIQNINASYQIAEAAEEFVLAVPGPSMVSEVIAFGTTSLRDVDKLKAASIPLVGGKTVSVPGIAGAIANIELTKDNQMVTGDHLVISGEVKRYAVNRENRELPLLSIGRRQTGYRLIGKAGMHRFATVDDRAL